MIAGTIIMEDQVLQFQVMENCSVIVTVSDCQTGKSGSTVMPGNDFAAALSIALSPEGEQPAMLSPVAYEELAVMASPVVGFDSETGRVEVLRWIP